MVVHGQIILNQFKNYPKKSVANSAFATGLKARMELRRHCKLYMAARPKARVRGLRANPMRDRAHIRMKPMTATATTMVKAIWRAYFMRTGQLLAGAPPCPCCLACSPFLDRREDVCISPSSTFSHCAARKHPHSHASSSASQSCLFLSCKLPYLSKPPL